MSYRTAAEPKCTVATGAIDLVIEPKEKDLGEFTVKNGCIEALPRAQTIEELERNLLICTVDEMIDRLAVYDGIGVDEVMLNFNMGQPQAETLDSMERFAAEVMPHFQSPGARAAAAD